MKQKKSKYGNINFEGSRYSKSLLINNREPDFLDEIEDGIKPIIKVLVNKGFDTYSSCQGHVYEDDISHMNFDLIDEKENKDKWLQYLEYIQNKYSISLKVDFLEIPEKAKYLLNKEYREPIRVVFIFPDMINRFDNAQIVAESLDKEEYKEFLK